MSRLKTSALDPVLEQDLHFEILKSERYRSLLLIGVFLLAIAMFITATLIWNVALPKEGAAARETVPLERVAVGAVTTSLGVIAYECFVFFFLNRRLQSRRRMPGLFQYGNTFVEISIPSLIVYYFSESIDPVIAFNSPAVWIYFFFIILSVLRLSLSVSLFTGAVAACEYLALSIWIVSGPGSTPLESYLRSVIPMIGRSLMLLVAGGVAGFVALELRRKITSSVHLADERSRVVGMFGQYVSPAVVEKLLAQKHFEPEMRHVCVMFLDIRDFTRFSEERRPEEVIDYLNVLYSRFIEIVGRHNGIINKFLGDGFMAVFGAPVSDGRDVSNAVHAALEILDCVEEMNRKGEIAPTRIGMGLHAGSAVTGNVGSDERKEYTIIGDTVNLASRIEQLNKEYGSSLLVTDAVYSVMKDLPGEPLPPIEVRGRKSAVHLIRLR